MMGHAGQRYWTIRACCAALGVAMLIGSAGLQARADDDDDLPDTKFFRSLLQSLGLRSSGDGIDYRERSPLVVPPSRDLPPPVTGTVNQRNPEWPNDPDVKRRREARAERKAAPKYGDNIIEAVRPLRPNEIGPGGNRTEGRNPADNRPYDPSAPIRPSELGYRGGLFNSLFNPKEGEYATFTGEVPRTNLIEPPSGYRTPSPTQPYGIGKERWTPAPVDRLLPTR